MKLMLKILKIALKILYLEIFFSISSDIHSIRFIIFIKITLKSIIISKEKISYWKKYHIRKNIFFFF